MRTTYLIIIFLLGLYLILQIFQLIQNVQQKMEITLITKDESYTRRPVSFQENKNNEL